MLEKTERMIAESNTYMKELAIGGTAVGTGINAHPKFGEMVSEEISNLQVSNLFLHQINSMH